MRNQRHNRQRHNRTSLLKSGVLLTAAVALNACATIAAVTLEDRFRAIGIPAGTADCMVADLQDDLSNEDLQDLARYTVNLARAESTLAAVQSLMRIDNPRAVAAVGKAGFSCVTGFGR